MREKHDRVRCELTAILNGLFERALMSAEPLRRNGRKNLLASEPHYRPSNKSGNNAQNDSYHRFLLFIFLKCLHQESARNFLGPLYQTHTSDRPCPAEHYFSLIFHAAPKLSDIRYHRSELPGTRMSQPCPPNGGLTGVVQYSGNDK